MHVDEVNSYLDYQFQENKQIKKWKKKLSYCEPLFVPNHWKPKPFGTSQTIKKQNFLLSQT